MLRKKHSGHEVRGVSAEARRVYGGNIYERGRFGADSESIRDLGKHKGSTDGESGESAQQEDVVGAGKANQRYKRE